MAAKKKAAKQAAAKKAAPSADASKKKARAAGSPATAPAEPAAPVPAARKASTKAAATSAPAARPAAAKVPEAKAPEAKAPVETASTGKLAKVLAQSEADDVHVEETPAAEHVISLPPLPRLPARRSDKTITLAIGTGSVQAFMLQGLLTGKVETEDRVYAADRLDFDALDDIATKGTADVVLLPYGAYPRLNDRYLLLSCGSCFGDQRGPLLITRRPIRWSEVEEEGLQVAVPGRQHTANMLLKLWLPKARLELLPMSPRQVVLMVRANQVRAGLLVDEEQITYRDFNLVGVQDLGQWWGERTEGLPVPLTALGVRRDIDRELRDKVQLDIKRSIAYALGHREDTLEEIGSHAPKHTLEAVDAYVRRYVNDLSLDCGERGRQAASLFYQECHDRGVLKKALEPVFHGDKVQ